MLRAAAALILSASLLGCTAQPPMKMQAPYKKFSAPIGQLLTAETGGKIFVEGIYQEGERISLSSAVNIMIPGSMMIPFPVYIGAGPLRLTSYSPDWKYYCGDMDNVAASFPGLGSVIANGDCVGIRVSTADVAKKEWVVDNSNYNRGWGSTIWSRSMSKDEALKYSVYKDGSIFEATALKGITFDGYHGGQLHFTWDEIEHGSRISREFKFDFDGTPTLVGIKGNVFRVIKADNVTMQYEWVKVSGQ